MREGRALKYRTIVADRMIEIKRRRRVARLRAASHLLRHGAVLYGVTLRTGAVVVAPHGGRRLFVGNCVIDASDVDLTRDGYEPGTVAVDFGSGAA